MTNTINELIQITKEQKEKSEEEVKQVKQEENQKILELEQKFGVLVSDNDKLNYLLETKEKEAQSILQDLQRQKEENLSEKQILISEIDNLVNSKLQEQAKKMKKESGNWREKYLTLENL